MTMRILIISAEVWQENTNGGNVLTNIFSDIDAEFAQIYCNPGKPINSICKLYYQMTDSMVIHSFLSHKPIGKIIRFKEYPTGMENSENNSDAPVLPNLKWYSFFHKHRLSIFYTLRHILWNLSNWKNDNLRMFIDDFQPDIIFAPCYGDKFMLRMTRFIAQYTGKRVISYISDDSYTLKQFSLSPFYWLNRFVVRYELRKTFLFYSLTYTMTELQKRQCERDFHANMKILRKSASFSDIPLKSVVQLPIKLVYAGGIYLNRWKTLKHVADAIRKINRDGVKMELHIYTGNEKTANISKALNDCVNSFIHGSVSQAQLAKVYHNSDIALHVESYDLKNRLAVRYSFSTKIVDCLSSGCAVMAICDSKQSGYCYLKENNAAICVDSVRKVGTALESIATNSNVIITYAENARRCCIENHNQNDTRKMVEQDFVRWCDNEAE